MHIDLKNQSTASLRLEKLSVGYKLGRREEKIIGDLTLSLGGGKMVCLLGPNGTGKTTLLRTIGGLLPPLAGQVFINNQPLHQMGNQQRARQLSMVFTNAPNSGELNVAELLALGRYPHNGLLPSHKNTDADQTLINQVMHELGIGQWAARKVFSLSDGQRQRVMLGRALVQDTPFVLLDEPTAFLDVPNRLEFFSLARRLINQRRQSFLMSTHELETALDIADEVWLLSPDGNLLAGVPADMVLGGHIQRVFLPEGYRFDLQHGRFLPTHIPNKPYQISGCAEAMHWTSRALSRAGIAPEVLNDRQIYVEKEADGYIWSLAGLPKKTYRSVASLLADLQ